MASDLDLDAGFRYKGSLAVRPGLLRTPSPPTRSFVSCLTTCGSIFEHHAVLLPTVDWVLAIRGINSHDEISPRARPSANVHKGLAEM